MELIFFSVFISPGLKDKTNQMRWLFEVLRDGLLSTNDWKILKNMDILNIFLVIFRCGHKKDRVI